MADDKKEKAAELDSADGKKGGKGKLLIIIIAVVVLLAGGGGAAFFLLGGDDAPPPAPEGIAAPEGAAAAGAQQQAQGEALYVGMPRPFVFTATGSNRDRLVQIKVQLMVRGTDAEGKAKLHVPLIESTLLGVFSAASAEDMSTSEGKEELRQNSLKAVQQALQAVAGGPVVEQVLFTGFVMQ